MHLKNMLSTQQFLAEFFETLVANFGLLRGTVDHYLKDHTGNKTISELRPVTE